MADLWAHRWPVVVLLHSQVTRSGLWGIAGGMVGRWGEPGVSGFLGRLNGPPSVQVLSAVHLHTPSHPRPTPCQPLSTPCAPVSSAGTQLAKPLGMTGCPAGQWTNKAPLAKARDQQDPPGGVLEPRRVCVTHSHFWAKIVTHHPPRSPFTFLGQNSHPKFTTVHHRPPPFHLRRTPG